MNHETMSREQLIAEINRLNKQQQDGLETWSQMAVDAGSTTNEAYGWQAVFDTIGHAIWVLTISAGSNAPIKPPSVSWLQPAVCP